MRVTGNLSRKITRFMVSLALVTALLSLLGTYAFYAVWFTLFPNVEVDGGSDWFPTPLEWGWMALITGVALSAAVLFALKLSKTIITPLNAIAESLRQVAQGNLSVRADIDGHPQDEVTHLVRDFNTMAERLERVERERQFWNAAIAHELRTPVTVLRGAAARTDRRRIRAGPGAVPVIAETGRRPGEADRGSSTGGAG